VTLLAVLEYVNDALFVGLAGVCYLQWRRQGGRAAGWLAATFGSLAAVVLLGLVLSASSTGEPARWVGKLLLATLVLFPYLLFRFTAALDRPARSIERVVGVLVGTVLAWTLLLPGFPAEGQPRPGWFNAYVAAVLLQWTVVSLIVAVKLWRAGRSQPTAARRRMRALSLAATGLSVVLVAAGQAPATGSGPLEAATRLLTFGSALLFYLAFAPPAVLRNAWRKPEQKALQRAVGELKAVTRVEDVAAVLLPHVLSLVGARGAALVDGSGSPIGSLGQTPGLPQGPIADGGKEQAQVPGAVRLPLSAGALLVWASPYAPVFGRQEFELLQALSSLAELALERVRTAERDSELAAVVDASGDAIVSTSLDGTIRSWNPTAESTYSRSAEQIVGRSLAIVIPPDRSDELPELLGRVGRGERVGVETRHLRSDGEVIDVALTAAPLRDRAGAVVGVSVVVRDISERQRAEATLRASEQRFRGVADAASDAIVSADSDGRLLSWNKGAERMLGWRAEEAVGRPLTVIIPERLRARHQEGLARVRQTGQSRLAGRVLELVGLRKDGTEFPIELSIGMWESDTGPQFSGVIRDISERQRVDEALRASELQFRGLLEAAPDAMVIVNPQGHITLVNRQTEQLFGYRRQELLGQPIETLVPERFHAEHVGHRNGYLAEPGVRPMGAGLQLYGRRKDASEFPVEISLSPLVTEQGTLVSAAVRDITSRKQVEEALELAMLAAEQANQAKSEYLSRMSHELRTPLNAILGFAQLLELDELRDDQRESVGQILSGGRHLLGLINEVLDIAATEAGRLPLSLEPVAVADVVGEAVSLIRPLADEHGILLVDAATTCQEHVRGDRQRLKQVLLNLLSNAVKYNRTGGNVRLACSTTLGRRLRIEVADTGPGIAADALERLFVPFERLTAEFTGVEGTGLGLPLSKRLAEAMGGTLDVATTVDQGSSFWVELPLTEAPIEHGTPQQDQPPHQQDQAEQAGRPLTVLCIEDSLLNLQLVEQTLLRRPGVTVISAMRPMLGLDLAREHHPDLLLLDLHLPDMPGQDVLRRLRADPKTAGIPVAVLSADARPSLITHLLDQGARAFLTKPLDVKKLLALLDTIAAEQAQAASPPASS
jgi:PAS domain S-box-containing protein